MTVRIYGITNPTSTSARFTLINIRFRQMDTTNYNLMTTLYEAEYNLFLNLKTPASAPQTYDTGKRICFVPPAKV